jgi:putative sugar O-methyltransferase
MSLIRSQIWQENSKKYFSNVDDEYLSSFRKLGSSNGKLTSWNANEKTSRWFKFLLFNLVKSKSQNFFEDYKLLGNINLGSPIFINFNDCQINLDYFLALEEFYFVKNNIDTIRLKSIVEIGSGFGRTAHTFIKLLENLEKYTIIDLPELLVLSEKYLRKVLSDELFLKIDFISNEEVSKISHTYFDLSININSFQEMPVSVIDFYISHVIEKSSNFYSRNAIAKYHPSIVDIENAENLILDVFDIGYCQDIIDIFNEKSIDEQTKIYINKYLPSRDWNIVNYIDDIFPFYCNVIYSKKL